MKRCRKTPYKTKKTAERILRLRNKSNGHTGGNVYLCKIVKKHKYHITKEQPINPKLWEIIKNDPQVQYRA